MPDQPHVGADLGRSSEEAKGGPRSAPTQGTAPQPAQLVEHFFRLEKGRLHLGQLVELGEVIAGTRAGRTSSKQTTLFESQGMAMQDLIIAAELARLAREKGAGEELPLGM